MKVTHNGAKILFSLFMSRGKKTGDIMVHDFFALFLWQWLMYDKSIPSADNLVGIYGEFLHTNIIVKVLEEHFLDVTVKDMLISYYSSDPGTDFSGTPTDEEKQKAITMYYHKHLKAFRIECLREILMDIEPLYPDQGAFDDFFTNDDISHFFQTIAKNRIWTDKEIQILKPMITLWSHWTNTENFLTPFGMVQQQIGINEIQEDPYKGIDWNDSEIVNSRDFEIAEKANWKNYILPEFHDAVDKIDLVLLKDLLKDSMDRSFTPKGWQGEFLLKHRRWNFVAASRRAGKSFLAVYLAVRQLQLPMQKVIYLVPTLSNHAVQAWMDMEMYLRGSSEYEFKRDQWLIVNKATGSMMRFVTSERKNAVRGAASHLLIVDEMAFCSEQVYASATPLIRTTKGMVYGISTVNPEVPKNFFYYELIDAEIRMLDPKSDRYARRVTLDENPFIPEEEKADIRRSATNIDLFNAEWMASFIDKDSFNTKNLWVVDEDPLEILIDNRWKTTWRGEALDVEARKMYNKYYIIYDAAKRKDKPAVTVVASRIDGGADVVMADYLDGFTYWDQADLIVALIAFIEENGVKDTCQVMIDYTGVGAVIQEIFVKKHDIYPMNIQWVADMYEGQEGYVWKVGKGLMKSRLSTVLELGTLKAFSFMTQLRQEFETYTDDGEKSRKFGHHYDMLSTLMMISWWLWKIGQMDKIVEEPMEKRFNENYAWATSEGPEFQKLHTDENERYRQFGF